MEECLLGIACKDFLILAGDAAKTQNIVVMKDESSICLKYKEKPEDIAHILLKCQVPSIIRELLCGMCVDIKEILANPRYCLLAWRTMDIGGATTNEDKINRLSSKILMATCGDTGDRAIFSEYIAKNVQLYKMRNGYELSPSAAATFTRRKMAEYLRSRSPYHVNLLIGGYDEKQDTFELYLIDYLGAMVKVPFANHSLGGMFSAGVMDRYHRDDLTIEEGVEVLSRCVKEVQKRFVINLSGFKVKVITREGTRDLENITANSIAVRGL